MFRLSVLGLLAAGLVGSVPAKAACQLHKIAELPVTMRNMAGHLSVKINGKPTDVIVDSGAAYSTLPRSEAKRLGMQEFQSPIQKIVGVGGRSDAYGARAATFEFGGFTLHNSEFITVDNDGAALLGQNILGAFDVEYDFGHAVVRIFRPVNCGRANLAYWAKDEVVSDIDLETGEGAGRYTIGRVFLNGAPFEAIFDSGAASTVIFRSGAARIGLRPDAPGVEPAGINLGIGANVSRAWTGPVSKVQIGGEQIANVRLRFTDSDAAGRDILIGMDFFLSHRVYVANSQKKMYFTYNGGPVFTLPITSSGELEDRIEKAALEAKSGGTPSSTPAPDGEAEGQSADELARLASVRVQRREYRAALADLDRAIALAPKRADILKQRAEAHVELGQAAAAISDLDAALALDPADVDGLMDRAELALVRRDPTRARADLDAAEKLIPPDSAKRFRLAILNLRAESFDQAIAIVDRWLPNRSQDPRYRYALMIRCQARAFANRELDQALADCNRALDGTKGGTSWKVRGYLQLRRKAAGEALADFERTLKEDPKDQTALYGRGLARLAKGDAGGREDIEAATKAAPRAIERLKRLGFAA